MAGKLESALSVLKYPLVFFGLALLVVEGAFGAALATKADSQQAVILLSSWMGGLFLVSILVVAFLVYKVPTHVMLESQGTLGQAAEDLQGLRERIDQAVEVLSHLSDAAPNEGTQIDAAIRNLQQILTND